MTRPVAPCHGYVVNIALHGSSLAEQPLRFTESRGRDRVHPRLLLLVVPSSSLRLQVQVWIDRSADCQFDAGDAG
jgi:hypothetical protein